MKSLKTLIYPNKGNAINPLKSRTNWVYIEHHQNKNQEIETLEVSEREYGNSSLKEYYISRRVDSPLQLDDSKFECVFISNVNPKETRKTLEAYIPKNVLERIENKK